MYLSKVLLSGPACRNPYEMHRALWMLFPEDTKAKRDFLFRVEQSDYSRAEVLMQSNRRPVSLSDVARIAACKEYRPVLATEQRLRFILFANPIKVINDGSGRRNGHGEPKKCRVPLIRENEQRSWIERKLGHGALLETLTIDPAAALRFRKGKEDRAGKIQPAIFKGVLKVQDAEAMTALVEAGIGPAKAFGCGLLSIAAAY